MVVFRSKTVHVDQHGTTSRWCHAGSLESGSEATHQRGEGRGSHGEIHGEIHGNDGMFIMSTLDS